LHDNLPRSHQRHWRASPTPAQALQQALGINELPALTVASTC